MMHCENRQSRVCGSEMAFDMSSIEVCTSVSWLLKYSCANLGEPIGQPSKRKPEVSSTGKGASLIFRGLGLVEYCAIVFLIEMASDGLYLWIVGGQAVDAICGRMWWYRCKIHEFGFVDNE